MILFKNLYVKGSSRSIAVRQNLFFSIILKGLSIIVSFLIVPLTLNYLNAEEYGVWLTLSSILIWIGFFDIGLGNGLRNKLTEAISLNQKKTAQVYVSTTFFILFLIMGGIFVLFSCVNPFLDWTKILNVSSEKVSQLNTIVSIVFAFFCLQFTFKIVGIIFIAHQKPALNDLLNVLGNVLSLIIIYLLTLFTSSGSLFYVAFTFSIAPFLVFLITYIVVFYFSHYHFLCPKWKYVKFSQIKDLMGLGFQFFIIQIASLVIYSTSNIIITQTLGPEQVTVYNIAYKYFSIPLMFFSILQTTIWNAYTDAWVKQDKEWIRNSIKRMLQIWILLAVGVIIMLVISGFVYKVWIGDTIYIPLHLSIACAIFTIGNNWSSLWVNFINGVGKIRMQLLSSVILCICFIPLALFFCKTFGIVGIVFSSTIALIPGMILSPIQFRKLMKNNARGIWNK